MEAFRRENLVTDDPPWWRSMRIAAILTTRCAPRRQDQFVKAISCCSMSGPRKIRRGRILRHHLDGFCGKSPSGRMEEIFKVVRQARDIGVKLWSKA